MHDDVNHDRSSTAPECILFQNKTLIVDKPSRPMCTVVVDAEEDFNWFDPVYGTGHSVTNMLNTRILQDISRAYGIVPTYLLTYPILQEAEIVRSLAALKSCGECDLGVQLHPWVNPPFEPGEQPQPELSFAGNLSEKVERQKLVQLISQFETCFGYKPNMYRAGRYGLSRSTPKLLEEFEFKIDTSIAPHTNFSSQGGPDYSNYSFEPFWFGRSNSVFEVPLCREIVGWSGQYAPTIYNFGDRPATTLLRAPAVMSFLRCAERITLSPEGNDLSAMKRLVRSLYRTGHRLFPISFHSSSLVVGRNPYVTTKADLHQFYDRLSGILNHLLTSYDADFVRLQDTPKMFGSI